MLILYLSFFCIAQEYLFVCTFASKGNLEKNDRKKMKENTLKVSFFVQAKRTDKKGLVSVSGTSP